ncbi:MAG: hypothetical protein ACSHX5_03650 [Phycisphaerales bacterium]
MNSKANERRGRALTFMLSMGMLAGVLIWAKLRLVTDIPRSALAIPEETETGEGDQGNDQIDTIEVESGWEESEELSDDGVDGSDDELIDDLITDD